MTDKEKKEWIIRYIRKNHLNGILNEKYSSKKSSVFRRYSSEIQSVCALLSFLVIGIGSLFISLQYNQMVLSQTQIMKNELKPVYALKNTGRSQEWDRLVISNNGGPAIYSAVYIIPFIEFRCEENAEEKYPIRVYIQDNSMYTWSSKTGELDYIMVHNLQYEPIDTLLRGIREIPKQYTDSEWKIYYLQLIIIKAYDRMGIESDYCFQYDGVRIRSVSTDYANTIIPERGGKTLYARGIHYPLIGENEIEKCSPNDIFKEAIGQLRNKGLYCFNNEGQRLLYGDYEPTNNGQ